MAIVPVIMCGGSGVRLWPASRPSRPKQFIPLTGQRSTFQDTVLRVTGVEGAATPIIVAGTRHQAMLLEQLADIEVDARLVLEPEARDSAPAMAAAALVALAADPEAVLVVVASDHHVPDAAAFQSAVAVAAEAARTTGRIVTLGVRPDQPSTAYGYIQAGDGDEAVRPVARFVEKPSEALAKEYISAGYLWNSGNFIVRADQLLAEFDQHSAGLRQPVEAAVAAMSPDGQLGADFAQAPKISFDYAVMEKTNLAAVLPVAFAWSDLGAWDAVHGATASDSDGNSVSGDVWLQGTRDSLVRSSGQTVVAIGLDHVAVIVEPDAVLVCALDQAQQVKRMVERLRARGSTSADLAAPEPLSALAGRLDSWLNLQAMPLWFSLGLDRTGKGFAEVLDQQGRAVAGPRRARVQPRQAYVFATAQACGWGGAGRDAAETGMAVFEARFRRLDGLFRTLCSETGEVLDDRAFLYDQAFALLAWSVLGRETDALKLLDRLQPMRTPAGGFVEQGDQPYQSNPHMHLFEAALAWIEAGQDSVWRDLAGQLGKLALERLIEPESGKLGEYFNSDWRPADGEAGQRIEPGHQFEWATLLAKWAALGGDPAARDAAERLYQVGFSGVDPRRGVVIDAQTRAGAPLERTARLWPQTEWLRAALTLGRTDDVAPAARAMAAYLGAPALGLWRDRMAPDGGFTDTVSPASSLYHIAPAITMLATAHLGPSV